MVSSKKAFKTLYKRSSLKKSHSRTLTAFINDHHSDSFNIKIIVVVWLKNWPQLFKRWITNPLIEIFTYICKCKSELH